MCILAVSSLIFDIKLYDSGKMYRIAGQTAAIKGVVESISTRSDDKCYAVVSVYSLVFSDDKYHRSSADAEKKELLLDDREKQLSVSMADLPDHLYINKAKTLILKVKSREAVQTLKRNVSMIRLKTEMR